MSYLRSISILVVLVITLNVVNGAKIKKTRTPKAAAAPVSIPAGFVKLAHKVSSGEVIIKDTRTIQIKSYSYDGAGPDAYFWVGKGTPTDSAAIVKGRKIADENESYDVLQGYEKQDIELILPSDITVSDIDYLSEHPRMEREIKEECQNKESESTSAVAIEIIRRSKGATSNIKMRRKVPRTAAVQDRTYLERRRINNAASKRSRDKAIRRSVENAKKLLALEEINKMLKLELNFVRNILADLIT